MSGNMVATPVDANNRYDVTHRESRRLRRHAGIEVQEERGKFGVLSDLNALITTTQARNLYRNYTQAKSILNQISTHVIGCGNRVIFETPNRAWNDDAAYWYEREWGANCDGRDYRTIHELNKLFLMSVIREHDCIVWFDRGGIIEQGKLFYWETDQICCLRKDDFERKINTIARRVGWSGRTARLRQESGVVYNSISGKPLGYIVTPKRGMTEVAWQDATILPHGPARLIKKSWRLMQKRGVADLLTAAANLVDGYEMLEAELAAAKTAAHFAIAIKSEDSHEMARGRADSSEGQTTEPDLDDSDAPALENYRNFERLSRGAIEYMEQGDSVEVLENKRPAAQMADFLDANAIMAGGSMGLPRFFTLMKADASFSAVRGEMNLGEATFAALQKFGEDHLFRWQVDEAITYGVATGQLQRPPAMWRRAVHFDHPKLKSLDEDKQTRSDERALRTNQKTLRDVHGPDWREVVDQRAAEIEYCKALGVDPVNGPKQEAEPSNPQSDTEEREPRED